MNNPLVSIVVITYNSSKYVLETLGSIKKQSYSNLELIISDDCSSDSTIEVCRKFIRQNEEIAFIRDARIISTSANSGITPNYNNGLKYASGTWIKYIAGDDMLTEDCIENYVSYICNSEDKLIVAGITPFTEARDEDTVIPNPLWLKGDATQQLKSLLRRGTFISGPTIFVHKDTLVSLGCFDEKYPFIEDYPLFIKFTKNNYRIGLINKSLIRWRNSLASVSHSNPKFSESISNFIQEVTYPEMKSQGLYLFYWHYFLHKKIILSGLPLWIKRLAYLIDPVGLYHGIKKLRP